MARREQHQGVSTVRSVQFWSRTQHLYEIPHVRRCLLNAGLCDYLNACSVQTAHPRRKQKQLQEEMRKRETQMQKAVSRDIQRGLDSVRRIVKEHNIQCVLTASCISIFHAYGLLEAATSNVVTADACTAPSGYWITLCSCEPCPYPCPVDFTGSRDMQTCLSGPGACLGRWWSCSAAWSR